MFETAQTAHEWKKNGNIKCVFHVSDNFLSYFSIFTLLNPTLQNESISKTCSEVGPTLNQRASSPS